MTGTKLVYAFVIIAFGVGTLAGFALGIREGAKLSFEGMGFMLKDADINFNINETALMCLMEESLNQSGIGIVKTCEGVVR